MKDLSNMEEIITPFNADFAPSNAEDWKAQLVKDLKGITFEDLTTKDRNGIKIAPLYTQAPSIENTFTNNDWFIMDRIEVKDVKAANKLALEILNQGATGLIFDIHELPDFNILFDKIDLQHIHTCIHLNQDNSHICIELLNAYLLNNYSSIYPDISIEIHGVEPYLIFNNRISINATIYANAGSAPVNELGIIAAQVNEALHSLSNDELKNKTEIHVKLAVDTQFYEQIAKLRALQNMIGIILAEYNVDLHIHLSIETAHIYLATIDEPNNILRNAIAGLAGVLGGAHNLYIQNYVVDDKFDLISRIGRNQQLIFREESYLDSVSDVSKGSYFIEFYTQELGEKAWLVFKNIELQGGWNKLIETKKISLIIENDANKLIKEFQNNSKILLGVNKYKPTSENSSIVSKARSYFNINPIQIQDFIY